MTAHILENPKKTRRTGQKVMKTLSPDWDREVLSWEAPSKEELLNQSLVVEVWDWDRIGTNDFLGMLRFPLADALAAKQPVIAALLDRKNGKTRFWGPKAEAAAVGDDGVFTELESLKRCTVSNEEMAGKSGVAVWWIFFGKLLQALENLPVKIKAGLAVVGAAGLLFAVFVLPSMVRWTVWNVLWYPLLAIPALLWWMPVFVMMPRLLGILMTWVITEKALHGYTLDFGEFHLFAPWVGADGKLHLRVEARKMGFGNPTARDGGKKTNYPHRYFVQVRSVYVEFAASWSTLAGLLDLVNTPWSPFPTVCARRTQRGKLAKYVGALDAVGEVDGIMINFEMFKGKFNINELVTQLAEGDIVDFIDQKQPPNTLIIELISLRNIMAKRSGVRSPYVEVSWRGVTHHVTEKVKSDAPLWQDRVVIPLTDPSTVIVVKVKDGSAMLGMWIMTAKWLVINGPNFPFCRANHIDTEFTNWKTGSVGGWFPLINQKSQSEGKLGEINMQLQWKYDASTLPPAERELTALQQLTMNSDETTLRIGNLKEWTSMLNCFPVLLNVDRLTFRDVNFLLKDLFMGYKGVAEAHNKKDVKGILIPRIDVTNPFRTGESADGLSVWGVFRQFWIHGLAPEVMKHKTRYGMAAFGQIVSAGVYNMMHHSLSNPLKVSPSCSCAS